MKEVNVSKHAANGELNLSLPLMDGPEHRLWVTDKGTDRSIWPGLLYALSAYGNQRLWEELLAAINEEPGDPGPALRVVEAWYRTMLARQGERYEAQVWTART